MISVSRNFVVESEWFFSYKIRVELPKKWYVYLR